MRKLFTLDDLYNFYKNQNENINFSSKDSNATIIVQIPDNMYFESFEEDNLRIRMKSCHIGENRNKSSISEKAMNKAIKSFYNKPILGYIHKLEDGSFDFAGHELKYNKDGELEYAEIPLGNIPESCNPELIYDEEKDKTYLYIDGIIYEDYTRAADILREKKESKVSVEIAVDEMSFDAEKKVLNIDAFRFMGITLLGRDIETEEEIQEGMEGAKAIVDFYEENNSIIKYSNIDIKLVETLDKLNETLKTFNINTEERRNEAMDNKELESVVEEVVEETNEASEEVVIIEEEVKTETEEPVVEAPSEESEESFEEDSEEIVIEESCKKKNHDLEEQFDEDQEESEEVVDEDVSPYDLESDVEEESVHSESESETESEIGLPDDDDIKMITHSVISGGVTKEFSISLNDVIFALTTLVNDTYSENDCDWYSVNVFDAEKYIEMYGWNKAYRQSYKVKNGNYSLVGDRVEVFAKYLTSDEIRQLENMKSNYSSIESELNKYEEAELDMNKMNVLNSEKYNEIKDTKQFTEMVDSRKNFSVEEIVEKADMMLEFAKSLFSAKPENKVKTYSMFSYDDREEKKNQPYGGIFKNIKK